MGKTAVQRRIEVPPMAARKRFGRYKDEKGKSVREVDVKDDEGVRDILKALERSRMGVPEVIAVNFGSPVEVGMDIKHSNFRKAQEALISVECSKKEVERFYVLLNDWQGEGNISQNAGLFLSALANRVMEEEIELNLASLGIAIDCLGWMNIGHLRIHGDAGSDLGAFMAGGRIVLEGNAGRRAEIGMRGGTLEIIGNSGDSLGALQTYSMPIDQVNQRDGVYVCPMTGGRITVWGDAGEKIGDFMEGGEIHVYGKIGGLGDVKRGKIYHKGKLIVDK
jgi:glutamate synthase domain-containing protein 3